MTTAVKARRIPVRPADWGFVKQELTLASSSVTQAASEALSWTCTAEGESQREAWAFGGFVP
jgi:hypothetical protein